MLRDDLTPSLSSHISPSPSSYILTSYNPLSSHHHISSLSSIALYMATVEQQPEEAGSRRSRRASVAAAAAMEVNPKHADLSPRKLSRRIAVSINSDSSYANLSSEAEGSSKRYSNSFALFVNRNLVNPSSNNNPPILPLALPLETTPPPNGELHSPILIPLPANPLLRHPLLQRSHLPL